MDLERVKAIIDYYDAVIARQGFMPRKLTERTAGAIGTAAKSHVRGMIAEMQTMIVEGRTEKCMRWLGFIQGVLWTDGMFTLEELKNHSRPDHPAPVIPSK